MKKFIVRTSWRIGTKDEIFEKTFVFFDEKLKAKLYKLGSLLLHLIRSIL